MTITWQRAIEIGIYAALSGNATLTALVGNRIRNEYAPVGTPMPFVVIALNSGRESNEQGGRRMATATHTILGVAATVAEADAVAAAIDGALHEQTLAVGTGWNFTDCKLMTPIAYFEQVEREQIFKRGGNYRTRVSEV